MKLSDRTVVTDALLIVVAGIMQSAGYRTSIGENVYVARENVEDAEMPCCVIIPGRDTPAEDAGPNGHVVMQYQVAGFVNLRESLVPEHTNDPGAEFAIVDAIIADLRQAIEGDGCALLDVAESVAYIDAQPIYHMRGGEVCGATLNYVIGTPHIDYLPGQ